MSEVIVSNDPSKPFGVFKTLQDVLRKLKDVGTSKNNLTIKIENINSGQNFAVSTLLGSAFLFTTPDYVSGLPNQATIKQKHWEFAIADFGKLSATYDEAKKNHNSFIACL